MRWWHRMTTFLKEVRVEMSKVSFPSRDEVVATTVVVVVASVIFGVFLFLVDLAINRSYEWLFRVVGT
ncbi:MAG TPA: preprotein translocase subunit SecE [Thermoanaerobaculia bacterium]|nr:preprotein translocase subunit SecE [Thermoanaerobaculia bacterium]